MKLIDKIIINAVLKTETGLHIGGSKSTLDIGGVDSNVIKTLEGIPYIPGSSIKGKLRHLLAKLENSIAITKKELNEFKLNLGNTGNQGLVNQEWTCDERVEYLHKMFGLGSDDRRKVKGATRFICRDAFLVEDAFNTDFEEDRRMMEFKYSDVKWENMINRNNGTANPRQLERVPAGAKFNVEFILDVYEGDDAELHATKVKQAFMLLENDYLGGNGSRGYGKVVFETSSFKVAALEINGKNEKIQEAVGIINDFAHPQNNDMRHVVHLKTRPYSQFHFGETALDVDTSLNTTSEILHSDTLYSAVIATLANVLEESDFQNTIADLKNGAVRFSSAFHCVEAQKDKFIYFLPKPVHYQKKVSITNIKAFKSVRYISKKVWEKGWCNFEEWVANDCLIANGYVLAKEEWQLFGVKNKDELSELTLFRRVTLPKTVVHKPDQKDSFYFQTNIAPTNKHAHFYFLIEGLNVEKEEHKHILQAIKLLRHNGIGGQRSTGCGALSAIEVKNDWTLEMEEKEGLWATVSLCFPENESFKDLEKLQYYKTKMRGGRRIPSDGNKKYLPQLRAIAEGAVALLPPKGKYFDLLGDGLFLRLGTPLSLPVTKI